MKKIAVLLLTATLFSLGLSSKVFAANSNYCDFSPTGQSGATSGNVTLSTSCVIYESANGVAEGDLTLGSNVALTLNKTLIYGPTNKITIPASAIIYVNSGGKITQTKLCIKDADSDGYADTTTTNLDPYTGASLSSDISLIDKVAANQVTGLCPAGYRFSELMNNLAMVDADPATSDVARIQTSDRELLRLGFTLAGIQDASAAVGDIQIIDRNLLICNGGACPAVSFVSPTQGNAYIVGNLGIGVTNPSTALKVAGTVSATDLTCTDCINVGDIAADAVAASEIAADGVAASEIAADSVADSELFNGGTWNLTSPLVFSGNQAVDLSMMRASDDATGNYLYGYKSRGTIASKTVITTGDDLLLLRAYGYDGASNLEAARITLDSSGTIASTRMPGEIRFATSTDAAPSVLTTRMTIDSDGNVGIGKTPTVRLDVSGDFNISGNTNLCNLVAYTSGSGTVQCAAGWYTMSGTGLTTGQLLCCKVSNPI